MADSNTSEHRRDFLALAATSAAASLGAMLPVAQASAAAIASTEHTKWLDDLTGKYRQVADWPDLNNGMGLAYTLGFLLSAPVGYGVAPSDVSAVLVLRHDTIPLGLADSMWAKYDLGAVFRINDLQTSAPATHNPYYLKPGGLPFADAALKKLIERGVKVVLCNLAVNFWSGMVAQKMGLKPEDVKQDWLAAVLPGITVVPSGVFACNLAQSRGCQYLFAG